MTSHLVALAFLVLAGPASRQKPHGAPSVPVRLVLGDPADAARIRSGRWVLVAKRIKLLLRPGCLLEAAPGSRFSVTSGPGCGRLQVERGPARILVAPESSMEVNGRTVQGPAVLNLDAHGKSCGLGKHCGVRPDFSMPPVPAVKLAWKIGRVRPRRKGTSHVLRAGTEEAVTGAAGGSMCLDTSSGASAAGVEQQGTNPVQKPPAKTLLKVRVTLP